VYREFLVESIIKYRYLLNNDGSVKTGVSIPIKDGGPEPRLPITIEHPLSTSHLFYKQLISTLGEKDLELEHIWGKPPPRSHFARQPRIRIQSSEGDLTDETQSDVDSEDGNKPNEVDESEDEGDDSIDSDDDEESTMKPKTSSNVHPKVQQKPQLQTTIVKPQTSNQNLSRYKPNEPSESSLSPTSKKRKS
jgi:hypothetical protein